MWTEYEISFHTQNRRRNSCDRWERRGPTMRSYVVTSIFSGMRLRCAVVYTMTHTRHWREERFSSGWRNFLFSFSFLLLLYSLSHRSSASIHCEELRKHFFFGSCDCHLNIITYKLAMSLLTVADCCCCCCYGYGVCAMCVSYYRCRNSSTALNTVFSSLLSLSPFYAGWKRITKSRTQPFFPFFSFISFRFWLASLVLKCLNS